MKDIIDSIITDAIDRKVFTGCTVATVCNGEVEKYAYGRYTYDNDSAPVNIDSIFDVASITKAIPVSSLALILIENGVLDLNDKMIRYVPEFNGSFRENITIWHLLTQTLHFNFRLFDCKSMPAAEIVKSIMNADLMSPPGSVSSYANATSILLGFVIERCTGQDLEILARKYFFEPMSMNATTFHPEIFPKERCVPTEVDKWRGRIIQGEVHDESAWALRPIIVGSAGLFSSISDLSKFLEMLVNKGTFRGKQIFKEDTVAKMYTNQLTEGQDGQTGLGWELNQQQSMGDICKEGSVFGKTGFTGCSIAVNPDTKSGYILLSNHLYPNRAPDRGRINEIRRSIAGAVLK